MNFIKKFYKLYLFTLLWLVIMIFFTSTLYYFNIIGIGLFKWLNLISILSIMLISGIKLGSRCEKNAYLEGGKFFFLILLLFALLDVTLFRSSMELKLLLYDFILLITGILGSMIGINKGSSKK